MTQGHLNIKIKIMVFSEITGPMKVKFYVEPPCFLCVKSGSNDLFYGKVNFGNWLFHGKNVKMKCFGNYCSLRPETWQMQTTYEVSKGIIIIIIIMTLFKEEAQLDKSNLP